MRRRSEPRHAFREVKRSVLFIHFKNQGQEQIPFTRVEPLSCGARGDLPRRGHRVIHTGTFSQPLFRNRPDRAMSKTPPSIGVEVSSVGRRGSSRRGQGHRLTTRAKRDKQDFVRRVTAASLAPVRIQSDRTRSLRSATRTNSFHARRTSFLWGAGGSTASRPPGHPYRNLFAATFRNRPDRAMSKTPPSLAVGVSSVGRRGSSCRGQGHRLTTRAKEKCVVFSERGERPGTTMPGSCE